ncbi:MAG: GTPase [Thermoprotei archaeon]|nr:MAG: GTPase [Thermoprotei archaeon]
MSKRAKRKVIIMGAAGRDFHNFNVYFRDNEEYEVVAFTAAQIPNITDRKYPPELSGSLYPNGIPIYPENMLYDLIKKYNVDEVVLSYSDLLYDEVMRKASIALSAGADFKLLSVKNTMLKSNKPVISVCAARTGAGKSTVSRRIARLLKKYGIKFVVIRHPMPYGDLRKQTWQRFETFEDLDKHECTIEEREEYEPHIREGNIVYAGVDYEKILSEAEKEAQVILWDGGNNDWSFYVSDLYITVVDPLRPGHELLSYPGEVNVRLADVIIINKVGIAKNEDVEKVIKNVKRINDKAIIIKANSEVSVDNPELIKGRRVLVVEDGPTVTHGGLPYAAGYVAAVKYGAKEIINPRDFAVGSIKTAYDKYSHIGPVLPALGYGRKQMKELEETINKIDCDAMVLGTPSDISRYLNIKIPVVKVFYELKELGKPDLEDIIKDFLIKRELIRSYD